MIPTVRPIASRKKISNTAVSEGVIFFESLLLTHNNNIGQVPYAPQIVIVDDSSNNRQPSVAVVQECWLSVTKNKKNKNKNNKNHR